MSSVWSHEELTASVIAYLGMQDKLQQGQSVNKNAVYQTLTTRFPQRSRKAFEYRMQNISHVMALLGREWISGLKPAKNVGTHMSQQVQNIITQYAPSSPSVAPALAENNADYTAPPTGIKQPTSYQSTVTQYTRDNNVRSWVLNQAQGYCECCNCPAPFINNADNQLFLEVHHLRQLAHGGSDTPANCVALCPNCHRAFHHSTSSQQLVERMYSKLTRLLAE